MFVDINSLLPKLIRRAGLSGRMGEEEIKMIFKAVVNDKFGTEKSSTVQPIYLRNKILTVASLSSDFIDILSDKNQEVIDEINKKADKEVVVGIDYLA